MSRIEKLLVKFMGNPKDLTWEELMKILAHYGFHEITKKGKTGGSRVRFVNDRNNMITLPGPHPGNIVKQYVTKQIKEKLKLWQII